MTSTLLFPEMTESHAAGWVKLHHINQRIANHLGVRLSFAVKRGKRQHVVPEVVADNCKILGIGTEEEIKDRINLMRTFYPECQRCDHDGCSDCECNEEYSPADHGLEDEDDRTMRESGYC